MSDCQNDAFAAVSPCETTSCSELSIFCKITELITGIIPCKSAIRDIAKSIHLPVLHTSARIYPNLEKKPPRSSLRYLGTSEAFSGGFTLSYLGPNPGLFGI